MLPDKLKIGFLTIHLYGLIIAVSIYAGYLLAKRRSSLYRIPRKIFDDPILLLPLVLAIVGARLYHVLDYWLVYSQRPIEILYIANGGLGIWGAITGAVLGFWFVAKVRNLNFLSVLDLTAPSLLLGQAIGRLGNYINQEGFGPPTQIPWRVYISPDHRPIIYQNFTHFHPTFFYEAIADLIFFVIIISLASRFKKRGQVFALYLMLYSIGRFIVEFWRIDTATIGTLKVAHVLSVLIFTIGIFLLVKSRQNQN